MSQSIRSFFAANNLFTPDGRRQIKRTLLSSGSAASRYANTMPQKDPSDFSGWRMGSFISCIMVGICFLTNIIFLGYVLKFKAHEGTGVLFSGNCARVKALDRWLHLSINMIGTALMASSNYKMQCLSAPTRNEANLSRSNRSWLDIGVPSVRNLWHISRIRVVLWILLAASSLPLHLLWNIALVATLQTNEYAVAVVPNDYELSLRYDLDGLRYNCNSSLPGLNASGYYDVSCIMITLSDTNTLTRLEPPECIEQYGKKLQSDWSNLLVVTKTTTADNLDCWFHLI